MRTDLIIFQEIINPLFVHQENNFNEISAGMKIEIDRRGCKSLVIKPDVELGKEYKGGIFPFFNNKKSGVCKICDYLIFGLENNKIYAILIELKKGDRNTMPQLKAAENFLNFIISTANRLEGKNINVITRKVSIKEIKRKPKTKIKDIEYDSHNHHIFEQNKFHIRSFLK
ncbi:hypothetical protein [Sphingobacterium daejeonense]|uniref:hypothetical protein n=1 Tax=Sphingobacterium daejeonense TaxID=371142 RepID=UPI0010C53D85|nr:hypothetical protein [Sphingobacterium daejeonense]VTQ01793.1 Uncharacterised protein [Sphingobacterium daejeonense]